MARDNNRRGCVQQKCITPCTFYLWEGGHPLCEGCPLPTDKKCRVLLQIKLLVARNWDLGTYSNPLGAEDVKCMEV